jgi:hypothetical protein
MKSTVTLEITIDEEKLKEKYPNYETNWNSTEEFLTSMMNGFETPLVDVDGKTPVNYLNDYGYSVMIMDKKEGPWQS